MSDDAGTYKTVPSLMTAKILLSTEKQVSQHLRIVENDFKVFSDIYEAVRDYYEQGTEMWRFFLKSLMRIYLRKNTLIHLSRSNLKTLQHFAAEYTI